MYRVNYWDSNSLLFTPRWSELGPVWQLLLWAVVCLTPLALIVWLYSYEMRLVPRLSAFGMLLLRVCVLALILFLILLEPVHAHTTTEEVPGRVIVAVDRSASMEVADPQRDRDESLRLAKALRYEGDVERVNGLSRREVAARTLAPDGGNLLGRVQAKHRVEVVGFARNSQWTEPTEWANLFQAHSEVQRSTDLVLPLHESQARSRRQSGQVLGVILLTDGQHNLPGSPVKAARELGDRKIPVFPVPIGAKRPPADLAVLAVNAPHNTFKNVDAPVEVRFRVTGLKAQQLQIRLHRPGQAQNPLEHRVIQHDGTDREYAEKFSIKMEEPGRQALVATVRPLDPATKETVAENNSKAHTIRVADDQARVLLVDGEARWEYHYAAAALGRDPTLKLKTVVFTQPRVKAISEEELALIGHPALQLPPEPDALSHFDCVILGDVTPEQLPFKDRERLEKWVADEGGTLIVVAGKQGMPLKFAGDSDPLARLLPIEQPRVHNPEEGFPFTLTDEGKEASYLQLDDDAAKSVARWGQLPKHYWGVVGKAKPGAVVLATAAPEARNQPTKDRRERVPALMARHNYGFGRVVYVGIDSTWRWRWREGDTYHHRFWGQMVRWAASDRTLPQGNQHIRFGTPEPEYRVGEPVKVLVRLGESIVNVPAKLDAKARIYAEGKEKEKPLAVVPLGRGERGPRLLEAQVNDLPPGRYTIELSIPDLADKLQGPSDAEGKPQPLRASFNVDSPESGELVELGTNRALLQEMAVASGGQVYEADELDALVERLQGQTLTHTEQTEQELHAWWGSLVLVVLLLTVEWVARKLVGLP